MKVSLLFVQLKRFQKTPEIIARIPAGLVPAKGTEVSIKGQEYRVARLKQTFTEKEVEAGYNPYQEQWVVYLRRK